MQDEESKKTWSVCYNPMPDAGNYYITYGFGYSKYNHTSCGVEQELEIFVPKDDSVKVQILKLKNTTPRHRRLKLVYYLKPVLGEDEVKTNEYLNIDFDASNNMILAQNATNYEYDSFLFVSSSEKIKSYTGDKGFFFGKGGIENPDGLRKIYLNNDIN